MVASTSLYGDVASLQGSEHRHTSSSLGVAVIPTLTPYLWLLVSCSYVYHIVLAYSYISATCLACLALSILLAIVRLTYIFRIMPKIAK